MVFLSMHMDRAWRMRTSLSTGWSWWSRMVRVSTLVWAADFGTLPASSGLRNQPTWTSPVRNIAARTPASVREIMVTSLMLGLSGPQYSSLAVNLTYWPLTHSTHL